MSPALRTVFAALSLLLLISSASALNLGLHHMERRQTAASGAVSVSAGTPISSQQGPSNTEVSSTPASSSAIQVSSSPNPSSAVDTPSMPSAATSTPAPTETPLQSSSQIATSSPPVTQASSSAAVATSSAVPSTPDSSVAGSTQNGAAPTQTPVSSVTSDPAATSTGSSVGAPRTSDTSRFSTTRVVTSALVTTSQQATVFTTVLTVGGSLVTSAISTTRPVVMTTGTATVTQAPTLNEGGGNGSSGSGLSDSSKKVIGGVVGGVGGAIVLGALAVVAWRLWGRKKVNNHDSMYEPFQNNGPSAGAAATASSPTPEVTGLERYQQPGGANTTSQPTSTSYNTSSNF